ncbi:MAG: hypothetical protein ACK5QS_12425 [Pseudanabaenaceae cyanobacterium]
METANPLLKTIHSGTDQMKKTTLVKLFTVAIGTSVSLMLTAGAAQAQALSTSFPQVKGKSCPGGFTQSRGMCTSRDGKKEGMVKVGRSCPIPKTGGRLSDTGAYCYREIKK